MAARGPQRRPPSRAASVGAPSARTPDRAPERRLLLRSIGTYSIRSVAGFDWATSRGCDDTRINRSLKPTMLRESEHWRFAKFDSVTRKVPWDMEQLAR
jgi:hypothetical protein